MGPLLAGEGLCSRLSWVPNAPAPQLSALSIDEDSAQMSSYFLLSGMRAHQSHCFPFDNEVSLPPEGQGQRRRRTQKIRSG